MEQFIQAPAVLHQRLGYLLIVGIVIEAILSFARAK